MDAETPPPAPRITPTASGGALVGLGKLGLVSLRVPLVLDCTRLATAHQRLHEAIAAGEGDSLDLLAVGAAAIALAIAPSSTTWRPPSTLRQHGGDVVAFGAEVFDALVRGRVVADDPGGTSRLVGELGPEIVAWVSEAFVAIAEAADRELAPFAPTPGSGATR